MKIIDLHCDTIHRIYKSKKTVELFSNHFHVDIKKLKEGHSFVQCFAIFIDREEEKELQKTPYQTFIEMIDLYQGELEKNETYLRPVYGYQDIVTNQNNQLLSSLLTVEEGAVLEGKLHRLQELYDLGVRLMTLTWNYPNEIGYPNSHGSYRHQGLTSFGCDVVAEMNRLGMIIDISHLSDGGFNDVLRLSKKPIVASHSNARSIKNHSRNLTDDMIKALADKGGVMGINFCAAFLGDSATSQIGDMIRHIRHIKNIGGIDVLALGSDFDGIIGPLEISNFSKIDRLIQALEQSHFTAIEIEKICYGNALRLMSDIL